MYEETFNRIATILDVIAESQSKHEDAMAEIRNIQLEHARAMTELRREHELFRREHEKSRREHEKFRREYEEARARDMAEIRRIHIAQGEAMERLTLKSAENEEKLNALITLMDQHIEEHRRREGH